MIVIVDTLAWVELLAGSAREPAVRQAMAEADVVVTPDLVLAELARKLARDQTKRERIEQGLRDIATLSHVSPITVEIALGVGKADQDLQKGSKFRGLDRPGLGEAVILATARALGGAVLTGDPHFKGLPETRWLGG